MSRRPYSSIYFTLLLAGCTNSFQGSLSRSLTPLVLPLSTSSPSPNQDSLVISQVTITASAAGNVVTGAATPTPVTQIFFDSVLSTAPVSNHCNTATTGGAQTVKPCQCQFSWSEINPNAGTGSSSALPHNVVTAVTNVQPNLVSCNAPNLYNTAIINNTQLKITLVAASSNPDVGTFTVNSFLFTKTSTATAGSFQDSSGHIFDNIRHYSCYQTFKRGMTIQSKTKVETNPNTGNTANVLFSSQFCLATAAGAGTANASCPNLPNASFSSQANFFNLYTLTTESGAINLFNNSFVCPRVTESLTNNGTIGTRNQLWPMDSTFALSRGATTTFTVGVQANTTLSNGSDPTAVNSSCFTASPAATASQGASNTFIQSCLGYAAPPNSDGTCPNIQNSSNQLLPTFRLRRYITVYPRIFDTDGTPISAFTQGIDTVYVLDRPVNGPVTANPLQPYTMLGPKPCPFSYFDQKAVGGTGYHATSNAVWSGKNIDGIEFPNSDITQSGGGPSCSAILPVFDSSGAAVYMATVNKSSPVRIYGIAMSDVYIRPVQPFTPHYEEDPDFQACAPAASPLTEAPLHFSRDPVSHNVAWCSESYPSQNTNITSIDPATPAPSFAASGGISPYTSHVVKNSASASCQASLFTIPSPPSNQFYNYPASGAGNHPASLAWDGGIFANRTCDRTVTATDNTSWPLFPLLASPSEVEAAISQDSSYMCMITFDNGGGKTKTSTPSSGCCARSSVFVSTGVAGVSNAHLEPDVACKTPSY